MQQFLVTNEHQNLTQLAESLFSNLDVSEGTIKDYGSRIHHFLHFIESGGLNRNSYLAYKRLLAKRTDYTVATKNKYLATAKVFLREMNRTGLITVDITLNIKLFRQIKKHKKDGLTAKEVIKVADHLRTLPLSPHTARVKAFFSLLALQGLRQVEIIRLDITQVDLVSSVAHVTAKGSDDTELIHLSPNTRNALEEHIKLNRVGSGALFKSLGNRKTERLSTMTIKRDFQSIFEVLGIQKSVHGFRHFYVTQLLSQFDVRDVRKFSRHKSLEMLIVYDDEIDIRKKASEVSDLFREFKV